MKDKKITKKNVIKYVSKIIKENKGKLQSIDFDFLRNNVTLENMEILETRLIITFKGALKND